VVAGDLHAAPAAAGGGLDDHRIADLIGEFDRLRRRPDLARRSRNHGNAELNRRLLGGDLVAHERDVVSGGADEGDLVLGEDLREAGVFGEEAVARMHGVGAGDLAGSHDRGDVEVAVLGGVGTDADALVGQPHMHGIGIGGRVHGDGLDAELLARAQDAQRDLAAVGDEDLVEHYSMTTSGSPYSTGSASSTRMREMVPERWAGIWFIVFMASMMSTVCPSVTLLPTATKGGLPGSGERWAGPTIGEVRVPGWEARSSAAAVTAAAAPAGALGAESASGAGGA